jgi:FkbM family methyltransferase
MIYLSILKAFQIYLTILVVFFQTSYNIGFNSKAVVIDIGLNVGVSALFFSQYENIEHIYAFEPFKETYEQALYNLELNKTLKDKVSTYNYGLLDKDEIIDVLYSSKVTISMSVIPDSPQYGISKKYMNYTSVILKSASREISSILLKTNKIILKMDCEGSEYTIIDSLNKSGVLKDIDYILLEWHHFKDPNILVNILKHNNFVSVTTDGLNKINGMIYAVKCK